MIALGAVLVVQHAVDRHPGQPRSRQTTSTLLPRALCERSRGPDRASLSDLCAYVSSRPSDTWKWDLSHLLRPGAAAAEPGETVPPSRDVQPSWRSPLRQRPSPRRRLTWRRPSAMPCTGVTWTPAVGDPRRRVGDSPPRPPSLVVLHVPTASGRGSRRG